MCSSQPWVHATGCHPLVAVGFCLNCGIDWQGHFEEVFPSAWICLLTCKMWSVHQANRLYCECEMWPSTVAACFTLRRRRLNEPVSFGGQECCGLLVVPAMGTLATCAPGWCCSGQTWSSVLFLYFIWFITNSLASIFLCTWRQLEVTAAWDQKTWSLLI